MAPHRSPCIHSASAKSAIVSSLALLYFACVYFRAATASLFDKYQPGIEALVQSVQPGLVLLVPLVVAYCAKTKSSAHVALWAGLAGVAACTVLWLFCAMHESKGAPRWVPPSERILANTVTNALLRPSFSGRSLLSIGQSVVFAVVISGMAFVLGRRRTFRETDMSAKNG